MFLQAWNIHEYINPKKFQHHKLSVKKKFGIDRKFVAFKIFVPRNFSCVCGCLKYDKYYGKKPRKTAKMWKNLESGKGKESQTLCEKVLTVTIHQDFFLKSYCAENLHT